MRIAEGPASGRSIDAASGSARGPAGGRSLGGLPSVSAHCGAASLVVLLAVVSLLPQLLAAQVRGVVVDSTGRPLPDAVVDLWTSSLRVGRAVTGPSGRFVFDSLRGGTRVMARRIGSGSVVRAIGPADSVLTLILLAAPVEVAEVEVSGACGTREDRDARARWANAARWYHALPDSLWLDASFKAEHTRLLAVDAERPGLDSTGYGWAGYRGMATAMAEAGIERSGYPAPDPERDEVVGGSLLPAELHLLVSGFFGARVRFTTLDDDRIRFCPRDRRLPWIEGEFKLAEDGSLLWARWRYGSHVEGWATGAVATFLPPAVDRSMPLQTATFLAWQERGSGLVARWSVEYREWRLSLTPPEHWSDR